MPYKDPLKQKAAQAKLAKKWRARKKTEGLCSGCGKAHRPNGGWCDACKERGRAYTQKVRLEVLEHYSSGKPKCACCEEEEQIFLCLDHINDDGAEKRRGEHAAHGRGGNKFYYWLRRENFPIGLQVLCHNCNMAKAISGKCPHQSYCSKPAI